MLYPFLVKKTEAHFGLESFPSASENEMFLARGGYAPGGSSRLDIGDGVYDDSHGGGGGFGIPSSVSNIGNGIVNSFSSIFSGFGTGISDALNSVANSIKPSSVVGWVFGKTAGKIFTTTPAGEGSDCPPGNSNSNCPNSHPDYVGPYK
jgi:hypothetical protein